MIGPFIRPKRGGFTLVELLTVIAIAAIVVAMSAGAAVKVVAGQRAARTEDGMRIMDKALHQHWNKVVEEAKKEADTEGPSEAVLALAGGNKDRAKVLWIIFRLTEAFPQTYLEVKQSNPAANSNIYLFVDAQGRQLIPVERRKYLSTYRRLLKNRGNGNQAGTQSAACLWMALTQVSRGGLKLPEDSLPTNIADTDKDGVKELVDGWVNPVNFQRFPVGNTELANLNPRKGTAKANFGDPIDPDGLLVQTVAAAPWNGARWYLGVYSRNPRVTYGQLLNSLSKYQVMNPQPYWQPYLASNGLDGVLGNNDDILSFRLRLGARGD